MVAFGKGLWEVIRVRLSHEDRVSCGISGFLRMRKRDKKTIRRARTRQIPLRNKEKKKISSISKVKSQMIEK